jgi:hypothetical protein
VVGIQEDIPWTGKGRSGYQELKDKCISTQVKLMIGNIEDLHNIWSTLDVCYERPEKYITVALLPILNFRRYNAFDNMAITKFYSLLRATIIRAKSVSLLRMLT